jgi:hypothetical protein
LGRVEIQQKSWLRQEKIEGSSVITHEGLTTMTHSTLKKIQVLCKSQGSLEEANLFTPTRHLLLVIKQAWQLDRIHGLRAVTAQASSPQIPRGTNVGGEHGTRTRYIYGTPWRTRIDEVHGQLDNMKNKGQQMDT